MLTAQPVGDELLVNTFASGTQRTDQESGRTVATAPDDSFVAVWGSSRQDGSGWGVYGQRFDSDGSKLGSEFQVNTYASGNQESPAVAVAEDGRFVIAWQSNRQDGSGLGIYAQLYSSDGTPDGDEFRVNETTRSSQRFPSVAFLDDGGFVVTWSGRGEGDNNGVFARLYESDGTPRSGEILVNQTTRDDQRDPAVAPLAGGGFAVAWHGEETDGSDGVFVRQFTADGDPLGDEIQVNETTPGDQRDASVASDGNGRFIVAWHGNGPGDSQGTFVRQFDADGTPLGHETLVNETTHEEQQFASVAAHDSGSFVVSWNGHGTGDTSGVFVRQFDSSGTPLTGEQLVNTTTKGSQRHSSLATTSTGFLVNWSGRGIVDNSGVFLQQFANQPPILDPIGDQTVNEEESLGFTATASDPDSTLSNLTFSLDPSAPNGATIDPTTGLFSWTLTESDGPGTYPVTVRVTDDDTPALDDSETIMITVVEVNLPPVLNPIGNQQAEEGRELSLTATASDPDVPANDLTFSLDPGAPDGAVIDPDSGVLTWTPGPNDGPGDFEITVRVTDDGSPSLDDMETIVVSVPQNDPPVVTAALFNDTAPGDTMNADGLTSDPTIAGSVTDPEGDTISALRIGFDDTLPEDFADATSDLQADGSFSFNSARFAEIFGAPLAEDGHVFRAFAIDDRGNVSDTFDLSFTLDATRPTVVIETPPDGLLTDQNVTVSGSTSDSLSGVELLQAQMDDGAFFDVPFDSSGNFSFETDLPLDDPTQSEHIVRLQATDAAGNVSDVAQVSFTIIDTFPPALTFGLDPGFDSPPIGDLETTFSTVTLTGETDPNIAVTLLDTGDMTQSDDTGQFEFTGVALELGPNPFTVRATDAAGNEAEVSQTIRLVADGDVTVIEESGNFVTEEVILIELGQPAGSRTLSFDVQAFFDTSDETAALEDLFLVYLVDAADRSHTLLDRGEPGTALFSLSGDVADFPPGLVRYDGRRVDIDLTGLALETEGELLLQVLNSDSDDGTVVTVSNLTNTLDIDSLARPAFLTNEAILPTGPEMDLSPLNPTTDVDVLIENVRFDSTSGRYTAELRVKNNGTAIGRNLAVLLPGLPPDVTLLNPSGFDGSGIPYLNMRSAIRPGGLTTNDISSPIQVEIDNPSLARFSIVPEILSGGPNRAPIFDAVGSLSVFAGGRLEVPVSATDPDGDRVTFAVRSTMALPTGVLKADGTLVLTPAPGEEGTFPLTLVASDGALATSQQVTLTVENDPVTTTRISGVVLNTLQEPLAGVPIELGRLQTLTAADGSFLIELPPSDTPTADFDISVPLGDPFFDPFATGDQTIDVKRSRFDPATGTSVNNPRQQTNLVTAYIDASMVYGSDADRAAQLRTNDGTGKLKTSSGDLLPFNDETFFPDGPLENVNNSSNDPASLFVAGDVRAAENSALTSLHTILVREHNRLAEELKLADPNLTGDEIYDRVRHMVAAKIQHITYQEFLPVLLGSVTLSPYTGYDAGADAGVANFFSTTAFRFGHSQANNQILRLDEAGQEISAGHLSLRDATFNSQPILDDGVDPILRGIIFQTAQKVDIKIIDELRNLLFGPPGAGGIDLAAVDIQRARDHGLPSYNQTRVDFGLAPAVSFADITSDATLQNALANTYGTVDQVDAWVGGLAEDHVAGGLVGDLFATAIKEQFERSRDGDRFWYENGQFTDAELAEIRGTTLASLIEQNSGITNLPANLFTTGTAPSGPAPAGTSAATPVDEFRSFDGTGNNAANPDQGSAGSNLVRTTTVAYDDGISSPAGSDRPGAREISNSVFSQSASVPDPLGATAMLTFWGQVLAHDIGFTPEGTADTLKIHGDELAGTETYPFVAEKLDLLLGHEVYAGTNNVIARPIFLPGLDMANAQTIDPGTDTTVSVQVVPNAPPVEVMVAAGTLEDRQGDLFTGQLSITQVPPELTPAALPANLFPDLVVTIQPGEMVFTEPAPVTFPNLSDFAPGTVMDLWSINPTTGEFEIVGESVVSADGTVIETVSGGIRNSSWHFVTKPPQTPSYPNTSDDPDAGTADEDRKGDRNPDNVCEECKALGAWTSDVELHSGAVLETHNLVTYQSLGVTRGLTLRYDSLRADPRPIVHFGYEDFNGAGTGGTAGPFRLIANMTVDNGGFEQQITGFGGGEFGLSGGEHFWKFTDNPQQDIDVALQADIASLSSGEYTYSLTAGFRRFNGERFTGSASTVTGSLLHVNSVGSPFGAGWGIAGLQELVVNASGSILLIDGDGSELLFHPPEDGTNTYVSPPGDFSTLVRLEDGTFQRTMTDQMVYAFNSDNKLASVTDRNGNVTRYEYDAGRLTKIIDPVELETRLEYFPDRVLITDPADRFTQLIFDEAGNLQTIIDPDLSERNFEYDGQHHLRFETDQRSFREESQYDTAGRARKAILKDGESELKLSPVQTQGLLPFDSTIDPFSTSVAGELGPVEATYTDANGFVSKTLLDAQGQAIRQTDSFGQLFSVVRNEENLITQFVDARGFITTNRYNNRGELVGTVGPESATSIVRQSELSTGAGPLSLEVADFNRDGLSDIITVDNSGDSISVFLGGESGRLSGPLTTAVPADPTTLSVGDFNNDQKPDVIVTTSNSELPAVVYLGNGRGKFGEPIETPIPLQTFTFSGFPVFLTGIAVGDFDNDGNADISAGNIVLFGKGDGTFENAITIDPGVERFVISQTAADLNNDGALDLILGSRGVDSNSSNELLVLLADGEGGFLPPLTSELVNPFVSTFPKSISTGDLDNDQNLDVIVEHAQSSASVLLGDGEGNLSPTDAFSIPSAIRTTSSKISSRIRLADLDADGHLDLVVTLDDAAINRFRTELGAVVLVMRGDGDGTFSGGSAIGAPHIFPNDEVTDVIVADINLDGLPDLVTANSGTDTALVLAGDGELNFSVPLPPSVAPFASGDTIHFADFDGDGDLDLLSADPDPSPDGASRVSLRFGNGSSFANPIELATIQRLGGQPFDDRVSPFILDDFNGDGHTDILARRWREGITLFFGNGDGTFRAPTEVAIPDGEKIGFGDVDSDGDLDLVATISSQNGVLLLTNNDTDFSDTLFFETATRATSATIADVDGDGNADILAASQDVDANPLRPPAQLQAFIREEDGKFGPPEVLFTAPSSTRSSSFMEIIQADIDQDGIEDLVLVRRLNRRTSGDSPIFRLLALRNEGGGSFSETDSIGVDIDHHTNVIDLDGDGLLDIVAVVEERGQRMPLAFLGNGDGTFSSFAESTLLARGIEPSHLTAADFDGNGSIDLGIAGFTSTTSAQQLFIFPDLGVSASGRAATDNSLGASRRITYDSNFAVPTSITDGLGRETVFDIDPENGNTHFIIRPGDVVTEFTYTPEGLIDTQTDDLGRVTDFDYDPLGRLEMITFAKGTADQGIQQFEYDDAGNQTAFIDENNNRTEFEYDKLNRLMKITEPDPDGDGPLNAPVTMFTYDEAGNLKTTTDARNNTTTNEYDKLGRLVKTIDANSKETIFEYDKNGNLELVRDPLLHETRNDYDDRNRLIETIDAERGITEFDYDGNDNLVLVIDPEKNQTRFVYDARNRLIREIDPLENVTRFDYDAADNIIAKTDRNDRVTEFMYDDLDRLKTETWVGTAGDDNVIEYTYDDVGNLLSVADDFSDLTFTYDDRDRVKTVDNAGTPGVPNVMLTYSYDAVGNVLSVSDTIDGFPAGLTTYAYDALNRTTRIEQSGSGVADKRVDLEYNPLGQFASIERFSDLAGTQLVVGTTYMYDALNRLDLLTHNNGLSDVAFYDFTYDDASRITSITEVDGLTSYSYDDRDQLTAALHDDAGNPDESYAYDANGNRTSSSLHGDEYVTGDANRLLSDGTFNYEYDDEGNMILRTEIATGDFREFAYDHRNRLTAVTDKEADGTPTQRVAFTYDTLDRRITKAVDDTPTDGVDAFFMHYVYDREDVILDFADADGFGPAQPALNKRYLHGPGIDQVLAQEDGASNVQWMLTDHLGTTRDLVDNDGIVVNHIKYDSFGNVIEQTNVLAGTRYLFTGREFDVEVALQHFRSRYYDSSVGRFITGDTTGFAGGDANLYRFVNNSPLHFTDPFGRQSADPFESVDDQFRRILENRAADIQSAIQRILANQSEIAQLEQLREELEPGLLDKFSDVLCQASPLAQDPRIKFCASQLCFVLGLFGLRQSEALRTIQQKIENLRKINEILNEDVDRFNLEIERARTLFGIPKNQAPPSLFQG